MAVSPTFLVALTTFAVGALSAVGAQVPPTLVGVAWETGADLDRYGQ